MNWLQLIADGESKTLEFKQELPKYEQIAKTLVAFANTSGGRLLVGVADNGEIIGIDEQHIFELKDKIFSSLYEKITPSIAPNIYTVNINSLLILVIEIDRGQLLPYALKVGQNDQQIFIRIGASNRLADNAHIAELHRQRQHIAFDEEININIKLDELDLSPLINRFKQHGLVLDTAKLRNFHLIKTQNSTDYPTNGLLILLGYFDHVSVQCARFKGETKDVFLDRKEYIGDIFYQLEQSEIFIHNHLNLHAKIDGLQRTDILEIPPIAIREALVNAFVHRDYANFGRNIKIAIFDDMVNIVSGGGLVASLTMQDLCTGRSEIRNPTLARVFKSLNYIEQWGSGIQRIRTACMQAGLKEPTLAEQGDFFTVELWRKMDYITNNNERLTTIANHTSDDTGRYWTILDDIGRFDTYQRQILTMLLEHQSINRNETAELLKLEKSQAYNILNDLVKHGILQRTGKARATRYVLNQAILENLAKVQS